VKRVLYNFSCALVGRLLPLCLAVLAGIQYAHGKETRAALSFFIASVGLRTWNSLEGWNGEPLYPKEVKTVDHLGMGRGK
jgi:hypothetical protein